MNAYGFLRCCVVTERTETGNKNSGFKSKYIDIILGKQNEDVPSELNELFFKKQNE